MLKSIVFATTGLFIANGLFAQAWSGATPGNIYYNSGKVGIGTSAPSTNLEIAGTTGTSNVLTIKNGGASTHTVFNFYNANPNPASYRNIFTALQSRGTLTTPTALQLGDQIFSVTGNGYDGTNFQSKFSQDFIVDGAVAAGKVPTAIRWMTSATTADRTEKMRISSNGNVGINTSSPQATLETKGLMRVSGLPYSSFLFPTSGQGFEMRFQTDANALTGGLTGGSGSSIFQSYDRTSATWQDIWIRGKNVVFEANGGGGGIVLASGGNVGVGTIAPHAKLDIAGNISLLTGSHKMYMNEAASFDPLLAGFRNNAGNLVMNAKDNGILFLNRDVAAETRIQSTKGTTTLDIAVFKPNGQVGIGTLNTTDAAYKLFVETGIRTRKVKVDQANWADYVFDPSYKLLTLQEVDAFIKHHKHLPDVPSAEEVKKEGIDLGDNQAILLKKIEELTLYAIEQHKKVEEQNKRIQKLEQLINKK